MSQEKDGLVFLRDASGRPMTDFKGRIIMVKKEAQVKLERAQPHPTTPRDKAPQAAQDESEPKSKRRKESRQSEAPRLKLTGKQHASSAQPDDESAGSEEMTGGVTCPPPPDSSAAVGAIADVDKVGNTDGATGAEGSTEGDAQGDNNSKQLSSTGGECSTKGDHDVLEFKVPKNAGGSVSPHELESAIQNACDSLSQREHAALWARMARPARAKHWGSQRGGAT